MNNLYPIFLKLKDKVILIIGGGAIAQQKVETLLDTEGLIRVISPDITDTLRQYHRDGKIEWIQRTYVTDDLHGVFIVFAATSNQDVQRMVRSDAIKRDILYNVVDVPDLCLFYVPSIVRQGHLKIGISTNGQSPGFAAKLRKDLEHTFDKSYHLFLQKLGALRPVVKEKYPDIEDQKRVFESIIYSPAFDYLREGQIDLFEMEIEKWISG